VQSVVVENFTVPGNFDVPVHLIQRLSQLSNTFMEPVPDAPHMVITLVQGAMHNLTWWAGPHPRQEPAPNRSGQAPRRPRRVARERPSIAHIRRPLTPAQPSHLAQTPLLSYLPTKDMPSTPIPLSILPPSYSLYPFIAAAALPWTVGTGGAFRIRRVGEWLGHEAGEDVRRTGGLARGSESLRTPTEYVYLLDAAPAPCSRPKSEARDVRAVLLDGFDENSGVPLRVSAS
jgi:hypothetical protein